MHSQAGDRTAPTEDVVERITVVAVTPRAATSICFLVNGALVGTWVAQIPFVQERFDVSKTTIGVVLLFMAAGAFVAMPLTGQVLERHASARVLRIAAACVSAPPAPASGRAGPAGCSRRHSSSSAPGTERWTSP